MPVKSKAVYVYPLQVWLTTICLGSFILSKATENPDLSLAGLIHDLSMEAVALFLFVLFVPCFFLLLAAVIIADWFPSKIYIKRIIIAIWGILLVTAPLFLVFGISALPSEKPSQIILSSYIVPLLASVFIFRWPHNK